jgi:hypothetical protein
MRPDTHEPVPGYGHEKNHLELMGRMRFREALRLQDGDAVNVKSRATMLGGILEFREAMGVLTEWPFVVMSTVQDLVPELCPSESSAKGPNRRSGISLP